MKTNMEITSECTDEHYSLDAEAGIGYLAASMKMSLTSVEGLATPLFFLFKQIIAYYRLQEWIWR
jgi:hypothetical protein